MCESVPIGLKDHRDSAEKRILHVQTWMGIRNDMVNGTSSGTVDSVAAVNELLNLLLTLHTNPEVCPSPE